MNITKHYPSEDDTETCIQQIAGLKTKLAEALKARDEALAREARLREFLERISSSRTGSFLITSGEGHQTCVTLAEKALSSSSPSPDWLAGHDAEVRAAAWGRAVLKVRSRMGGPHMSGLTVTQGVLAMLATEFEMKAKEGK